MVKGWREVSIGDVTEVVGGGTPSTADLANFDGDIPWLTPRDLSGVHDRYMAGGARTISRLGLERSSAKLVPAGSVLLTTRAPIGYVALAKSSVSTNQGFRSLIPCKELVPEFLYYWLLVNTSKLRRHASGSTFKELSGRTLAGITLPLPPKSEQRRIAAALGVLDDKIELNYRMATTLDGAARTLFKSWFVDFDPIRRKTTGSSMLMWGADAAWFPDHLTMSEIGRIPDGWSVQTLGDLCEPPQYGYTASGQDPSGTPKLLRITDINKKPWIDWQSVPSCEIDEQQFEKYRLRKGDVLIARMADPGHGVVVEEDRNSVFASYLIRFRPVNEGLGRFLQYWLRSDRYWVLVSERCAGTTRTSLNARALSRFPLVVPPTHVADAFAAKVSALRDRVIHDAAEAAILAELRDALLPKLISGRIRIAEAEQLVENAT